MNADIKILAQLKKTERKYVTEIQKIFEDLNKVAVVIGQVQENINDLSSIDKKFSDLDKMFKLINKNYQNKKRRLIQLQENRRLILDRLYKKYPKSKIDKLLKEI